MQLFSPRATTIFRVVLTLLPVAAAGAGASAYVWARSGAAWNVGKPAPQPIPFRHDVHAGALRIDCRYCHASVERSASAGMPSATTCMSCHSQVWAGASVLEPLRSAIELNQPITWNSVHRLPDYAYFHHAAHVAKGVACETCHGRVDQMARTVKANTLSMGWCLDCHRQPTAQLRPRDAVFAMGWTVASGSASTAPKLSGHADVRLLTSCSTCHR
ncbi:MAG TPA: cytochrome c3 family protein [Beijerinckiaceae bacterium]|jgi:NAD-dependent SIR2 family protein deacetylase